MNKQEKLIWNKLKNEYADNTEVLDVLCGGENAREKQIPKKPLQGKEYYWIDSVKYRGRYRDVKKKAYDHRCPSCGKIVSKLANSFCNYCGQAIDWRCDDE